MLPNATHTEEQHLALYPVLTFWIGVWFGVDNLHVSGNLIQLISQADGI